MMRAGAFIIAACVILVAGSACGSSKSPTAESQTSTPAGATPQAAATSAIPLLPTLTDPAAIALVPRQGVLYGYDISLPETWKPSSLTGNGGYEIFDVPNANGLLAGYVAILCAPPRAEADTSKLLADRIAAGTLAGGQIGSVDPAGVGDVQVGSLSAATIKTTLALGPVAGRTYHYYIATPECGWEVALSLFSPGDDAPYWTLFDRIAQTFRPKTAG